MPTRPTCLRASTTVAVLRRVSDEDAEPIRTVNPRVPGWQGAVIDRLMRKDSAERFQSASGVASLLEGFLLHLRDPRNVPAPMVPHSAIDEAPPTTTRPRTNRRRLALALLAASGLSAILIGLATLLFDDGPPTTEPAATEIYQDFRNEQPLLPSFAMAGPGLGEVNRSEPAGLRITLPGTRPEHYPVSVVSKFTLPGDFEATGSYEILSAARPTTGYGVGVALSVTTDPGRRKFAKVARLMLPKEGSVYKTEYWKNDPPKAYTAPSVPTTVKAGKLRLVREGPNVRCLVADGPDDAFRQLLQVPFGTDELPHLSFAVTDSGAPGNDVDVRLIDLRVRSGKPLAVPAPAPEPTPPAGDKAVPNGSLLVVQVVGGVVTLVLLGLGAWLAVRRRGAGAIPAPTDGASPALISFACPGCGKTMKVPANLAGKKGKCRHCGQAVLVPTTEARDPETT